VAPHAARRLRGVRFGLAGRHYRASALLVTAGVFAFGSLIFTGVAPAYDPAGGATTVASTPTSVPATAATSTRCDQTNAAISYSGTWGTLKKAAAYGRSYARAGTAGASANIVFDGTRLDWIATKSASAGVADVYLDGSLVQTVSLAAPAAAYQQDVWSTGVLTSGTHTLRIVRSASNASGKYITIDGVDVAGSLVKCQWLEQASSLLGYQGSWTSRTGPAYSGNGDTYCDSAGASVTAGFTGTSLAWVGQKGPTYGIAKVTVDGTQTSDVDLYGPSTLYQQQLWDTGQLSPGAHTVKIEWTGTENPLSAGTWVGVDGLLVAGTMTQSYVSNRFEDSDQRVLYLGTWTTNSAPQVSGGGDKRSGTAQAAVTVTFSGKQLDWIATTGPGMGKADVSLDNGSAQPVDLSGSTTLYQQKIWSTGALAAGTHTVVISWNKNNAAGAIIDVDAFDVLGTLPSAAPLTAIRIKWAEQRLTDLSYRSGKIDGVVDYKTRAAVTAFEKWEGLPRNGRLTAAVFSRLQTATRPKPSKKGGTNPWIEVSKAKQVLLYCKNGAVVWTLPVSTGSASVGVLTPSGSFRVRRKTLETDPRYHPLYLMARPSVLAIHGYPNVPSRRASHGCIRVQLWDQRDLYPLIRVGTSVYIY
jgi:lipoprotein-anchoring transpeptidase ErfK/SrfK